MYLRPSDKDYKREVDAMAIVINNYLRQPDVLNGTRFNMGSNKPRQFHEAISTTGYCVKVSEDFMLSMLRKMKGYPDCNLLSVAIDANKWGKCGDGSHNAWHTCCDTGRGYVVDLTIEQFGSKYAGKYIWPKVEWLKEFMNRFDSHNIGYLPYKEYNELYKHFWS